MRLQGKRVAVVAPAGIPDMNNIERSVELLESWGLTVIRGEHLADRFRYLAGTNEHRAADLHWALSDPSIDIVWIARGGYGCVHCLPSLPDNVPCHKTVIGFSDATAVFCALRSMPNVRLIHGPSLNSLAAKVDDHTRQSVLAMLQGIDAEPVALRRLHGSGEPVEGVLGGGNVTVLASLAGTRWQARWDGAIVLLEDVTELAYRIDRSVTLLKESGTFDGARAFVLGDFIRCPVPAGADFTVEDVLVDLLRPFGVPILAGFPIGHGARNVPWEYGARASIQADTLSR
jgi:muramoyltetrapeptide carboxypeptidase